MEHDLSIALSDSISKEATSLTTDFLEIGLDAVMDDGILKEIPILSTAVGLYKIGHSLKERHYIKKLIAFIDALNKGVADEEKREYYKSKVKDDPKRRNKELEYILLLIDRYIQTDKAQYLAIAYLNYLDNYIQWDKFVKATEILDRLFLDDLDEMYSQSWLVINDSWMPDSLARLIGLGLAYVDTNQRMTTYDDSAKRYYLTSFGNELLFCFYRKDKTELRM